MAEAGLQGGREESSVVGGALLKAGRLGHR